MSSQKSIQTTSFSDLAILDKINQARFDVFLAHSPSANSYFALKAFPFSEDKPSPFFLNEMRFSNISHPNIISPLHHAQKKTILVEGERMKISYIVMELAPYGDFLDLLMTRRIILDEKLARTYFHQLIDGLEYLHSNNIGHMDIKLENLLVGDNFQLKIADFDYSVLNNQADVTSLGTVCYRAPEVAEGTCRDSKSADVYSAGVMLFLFKCGGVLPHVENTMVEGSDLLDLLNNDDEAFWEKHCEIQDKLTSFFDEDFKSLFTAMTKADATKRMTIAEVRSSKWFNGPAYTKKELIAVMEQNFD